MAGAGAPDPSGRKLRATVVYALAHRAHCIDVELAEGATLADAVNASGLRQREPALPEEIDLGVHGRPRRSTDKVRDGDRIEVYRSLTVDPKEARRIRAEVKQRRGAASR